MDKRLLNDEISGESTIVGTFDNEIAKKGKGTERDGMRQVTQKVKEVFKCWSHARA
ncbi:hypothetical protein X777_01796 [Ooceraea biroi]|uniref:Uncharacterized protein n=1 Tax=Ooceraea biroi TaxID=2015173 RepID=A0A026WME2_OOCBI|nr:hypothetical protein X777_01796 [Ooceraea biroi]